MNHKSTVYEVEIPGSFFIITYVKLLPLWPQYLGHIGGILTHNLRGLLPFFLALLIALPGVTDNFGLGVQNVAGQRLKVLPREGTGHSKHPLPTTQEKTLHMGITRWSKPETD